MLYIKLSLLLEILLQLFHPISFSLSRSLSQFFSPNNILCWLVIEGVCVCFCLSYVCVSWACVCMYTYLYCYQERCNAVFFSSHYWLVWCVYFDVATQLYLHFYTISIFFHLFCFFLSTIGTLFYCYEPNIIRLDFAEGRLLLVGCCCFFIHSRYGCTCFRYILYFVCYTRMWLAYKCNIIYIQSARNVMAFTRCLTFRFDMCIISLQNDLTFFCSHSLSLNFNCYIDYMYSYVIPTSG